MGTCVLYLPCALLRSSWTGLLSSPRCGLWLLWSCIVAAQLCDEVLQWHVHDCVVGLCNVALHTCRMIATVIGQEVMSFRDIIRRFPQTVIDVVLQHPVRPLLPVWIWFSHMSYSQRIFRIGKVSIWNKNWWKIGKYQLWLMLLRPDYVFVECIFLRRQDTKTNQGIKMLYII